MNNVMEFKNELTAAILSSDYEKQQEIILGIKDTSEVAKAIHELVLSGKAMSIEGDEGDYEIFNSFCFLHPFNRFVFEFNYIFDEEEEVRILDWFIGHQHKDFFDLADIVVDDVDVGLDCICNERFYENWYVINSKDLEGCLERFIERFTKLSIKYYHAKQ